MDMYYKLKDELSCQDCKFPLSYSERVGYMRRAEELRTSDISNIAKVISDLIYVALCPACGKEYEITLTINPKRKEIK
jgi:uncharacterized protein YbaR (Trm112 family)